MNSRRLVCLILAFVTLLIYWPTRHYDFVLFDDPDYVQNNSIVQQGLTWDGIKWAFTTGHAGHWHPLTWISLMLDCQLFGPEAGSLHLVNVLIHSANIVLFFLLLSRMTGGLWPAAFAAGVFAWHPLRVESVAWISERKDVLCAFFVLLALLSYLRYAQGTRHSAYWLTLAFFTLALLAKPMAVTLPFILLLLDYWPLRRTERAESIHRSPWWWLFLEKSPFFLLTAGSSVVTYLVQLKDAVVTLHYYPLGLRSANAVIGYGWYLFRLVWPVDLAVCYPANLSILWPQLAAAALVILAVSLFTWSTRKSAPYFLIGWLWFLGTLVPTIGLVQVGSQTVADRYSYLPSMGLLLALAAGIQAWLARKPGAFNMTTAIGSLILGVCALTTSRQLQYWQNSYQLFRRAVTHTTDNAPANMHLAATLAKMNRKNEAAARYREALRIAPNDGLTHDYLANILMAMGNTNTAAAEYREALKFQPDSPVVRCDFGLFLARTGHDEEAVAFFKQTLNINPTYVPSLTCLARLLATDEDSGVRNGKEAVSAAERANELTDGRQPLVLDTLAAAYAEAGRFSDAIQAEQKAIDTAKNLGDKEAVPELQERLQLYQSNRPYRETAGAQVMESDRP